MRGVRGYHKLTMNCAEQAAAHETAAALDAARSRVNHLQECLQQREVCSLAGSCVYDELP